MINYLIFGLSYAFACVVQPGPFQAFLLSQSLTNGWRKTIPLVFAPLVSDIPVIILVLLVITNLPQAVLWGLQCLGGLFLIFLAFNAYKSWRNFNNKKQDIVPYKNFFKAVVVSLLNPNPYLGWSLVLGPILIKAWTASPVNGVVLLTGFYGSMVVYSIGMIWLFAAARNLGPKVTRISIAISAVALLIFGIYQLWSGINAFL